MNPLDAIAERRIAEAQARGEFDGLPGAGAPLDLGDDALVPEDLRAAYRVLKNAGYLPPEIASHGEIRTMEQLLLVTPDEATRASLLARIDFLLSRGFGGRREGNLSLRQDYLEKLAEHFGARRQG